MKTTERTYSSRSEEEAYVNRRQGVTPRHVAEYIMQHPYYGRDHQLAEGWLVVIDAVEEGEDPLEKLQEFVTRRFLDGNNNGVPQELSQYEQES